MITKTGKLLSSVKLQPHQEDAVNAVERANGSIILAHPTGSGKTVTSIAAFERLKSLGKANKALVVTPASLRTNFVDNGINKFTNDKAFIYGNKTEATSRYSDKKNIDDVTPSKSPTYGIVSYEMFTKDPEKHIKNHGADTVIFDELHRVRNDKTKTYKELSKSRNLYNNVIGLTASEK